MNTSPVTTTLLTESNGDGPKLAADHPARESASDTASLAPSFHPTAEAVEQIGGYKILGVLGSGGMGIVYRAIDPKFGRIVALKMLHVGADPSPEALVRFRGEAEM